MAADDYSTTTNTSSYRFSWDVFLSFRGEDTRHGFTAALYDELVRQGVRAFRDDEGMERGDEIAPTLLAAIQDSAAAIAVMSENYATSKWCLEELASILACKRLMLPVFYGVDPSHVRWQTGPFEAAFRGHEQHVEAEKVEKWRSAMKLAGNTSGYDSRLWNESELIQVLVKKILAKLDNTPLGVAKYQVGLVPRLEVLLSKLDVKCNDIRVIGFYGMGGIGKTTLAKALFNKLVPHFQSRSFLSSIREISQEHEGLARLQGKLIGDLCQRAPQIINDTKGGVIYIKKATHDKPILLVLDDVDNSRQLDVLAGSRDWFHAGSRIVITSRDKEVLVNNVVNEVYEVTELDFTESVQLFSYHAFGRAQPAKDFREISEQIVSLAGGLPLAIEVFGSLLFFKRSTKEWREELEKLKLVSLGNLQGVLEISFSSLDEQQKCIFLDLACFFVNTRTRREDAIDIFKGCGFQAETAITDLTAKSLIKIIDDDILWMHDKLRDMGREIVRRDNYVDAGQRSRLWDRAEILKVLKNKKGTKSIEGVTLHLEKKSDLYSQRSHSTKVQERPNLSPGIKRLRSIGKHLLGIGISKDYDEILHAKSFRFMINLRLLQINDVKLEGNFKLMPAELKWLQWKGCPLKSLPSDFKTWDLAVLDLSESKISHLWSSRWGKKDINKGKKLQVLNLRACRCLQEIPNLAGLALEKLILEACTTLVKIHKSVGDINTLTYLNMKDCTALIEFPNDVSGLKSLEKLVLSGCRRLAQLPEDMSGLKSLRELLINSTAIVKLPDTIFFLKNLEVLDLSDCEYLELLPISIGNLRSLRELLLSGSAITKLPDSIGNLSDLEKLYLSCCKSLNSVPRTIGNLKSLIELFLDGSSIEELPESIGSLSHLKILNIGNCHNLSQLPNSIGQLSSLVWLRLERTPMSELPDTICALNALEKLDMGNCQSLRYLPDSIGNLSSLTELILIDLSIMELPESLGSLERLDTLRLDNCKNLRRLPSSFWKLRNLDYLVMAGTAVTELPAEFGMLSNLQVLKMRKKSPLEQQENNTTHSESVVLPMSFSNLSMLKELDAHAYKLYGKISDDFEKLSSLRSLDLGHNRISSLPSSLRGLSMLSTLLLPNCEELKTLPPLPSSLFRLNIANCTALEFLSDLSNLESLQELELTNCKKINDIPGLEYLKSLRRLYTGGCNACLPAVKRRLSKVALKHIRCLCVSGSNIPSWLIQEVPTFSRPRNRELKGIIIGVVLSLDQQLQDDFRHKVPAMIDVQAKIVRLNVPMQIHTLPLLGIPNTNEDWLYICRFHDYNPLVFSLQEGDNLVVAMREVPFIKGLTLKKHGFYLVFENDDDYDDCDEALFNDETQQSVSKRLANFFSSL